MASPYGETANHRENLRSPPMHDINLTTSGIRRVLYLRSQSPSGTGFPGSQPRISGVDDEVPIVIVSVRQDVKFEISCHPNWRTASSRTTDKRKWTQMRDSSEQSLLKISVHLRLSVVKNLCLNYDRPVWQRHAPSLQPLPVASVIPLRYNHATLSVSPSVLSAFLYRQADACRSPVRISIHPTAARLHRPRCWQYWRDSGCERDRSSAVSDCWLGSG
jgi:hypothetical protein